MSAPESLRIALDGHCLGTRSGGNESYVAGLLEGLAACDFPGTVILYAPAGTPPTGSDGLRLLQRPLRSGSSWLRLGIEVPSALRRDAPDLAHFQYIGPARAPCPVTVAIHDTSFLAAPELLPAATAVRLRRTTGWSIRRAAAVLVPSEWTAASLVSRYPEAAPKVRVVPLAASSFFRPAKGDEASADADLALPERFLLYAGRRQRRKSVGFLIRAYAEATTMAPEIAPLLLIGPRSREDRRLRRLIVELGLEDRVRISGFVSGEVLRQAYRRAELLCYPCRFEGFGLPVAEALACGCPVLAADEAGLPETIGEAGWLLPPDWLSAWADGIVALSRDAVARRELSRSGLARCERFSWARTATGWLDASRAVVERRTLA